MTIFETLAGFGVVPVIAIDDADNALPLADALAEGGLPVAEITFRTKAAGRSIETIAKARPDMNVGAGTILDEDQLNQALDAGARFALSPGLDREIVSIAARKSFPFAPGIMTPSDLQAALRSGCQMVKFFPAMAAGGPTMLKNISAPFLHTGIGFNPTGGVTLDNMADWLAMPQVRAVGGTWIAAQRHIAEGQWQTITDNARAAVDRVAEIRGTQ